MDQPNSSRDAERFSMPIVAAVGLMVCTLALPLSAQRERAGADVRITVIGCVQRSEPSPAETVGTTAIPAGETRYVLSNITMAGEKDRPTTTTPTSGDLLKATANLYRLDDRGNPLIAPHVGERVQVTGTIVNQPPAPIGTTGPIKPDSHVPAGPLLLVESLQRMSPESSTCSR
jgi:hypothetical protein